MTQGASQAALVVKQLPAKAGDVRDVGCIPGRERSPRGGHSCPLQYSRLENPRVRGDWQATVPAVGLKRLTRHAHWWKITIWKGYTLYDSSCIQDMHKKAKLWRQWKDQCLGLGVGKGDEQMEHRGLLGSENTLYDIVLVDTRHKFVKTHRMDNTKREDRKIVV